MSARRNGPFALAMLAVGFAFLYGPVLVLIAYSFNASRLVAVWGGLSPRWYGELLANEKILGAALLSVQIGAVAATLAVVLGTAAALARFGRFRGRGLFTGLMAAPLVMPDIVTGLALLLLFVWLESVIGWPAGRGGTTIAIAHVTVGVAFATVVVRSRLAQLDRDIEAAAADLGATPARVLMLVTLPLLAPGLAAAWLLAFTISFDDVVIASLVSGPGASTLPIVVFSSVRLGVSPEVNALAAVIVIAAGTLAAIAALLLRRRERSR